MTTLTGQLLVAMPQMMDPRFARSVVYLCAHSEDEGAMGLVVNKLFASLSMDELFARLSLEPSAIGRARPVHFGGPVEPGRGFVLHTADYREEATLMVGDQFAVTATLEILRAIGKGEGPRRSLLALARQVLAKFVDQIRGSTDDGRQSGIVFRDRQLGYQGLGG